MLINQNDLERFKGQILIPQIGGDELEGFAEVTISKTTGVAFILKTTFEGKFYNFEVGALLNDGTMSQKREYIENDEKTFFSAVEYFEKLINESAPFQKQEPPSYGKFYFFKEKTGFNCFVIDITGNTINIIREDIDKVFSPPQTKKYGRLNMTAIPKPEYEIISSKFALNYNKIESEKYNRLLKLDYSDFAIYDMIPYSNEESDPEQANDEPPEVNDNILNPKDIEDEDLKPKEPKPKKDKPKKDKPEDDGEPGDDDGEPGDDDGEPGDDDGEPGDDDDKKRKEKGKKKSDDDDGEPSDDEPGDEDGEPGDDDGGEPGDGEPGDDDGEPNDDDGGEPGDGEPGDDKGEPSDDDDGEPSDDDGEPGDDDDSEPIADDDSFGGKDDINKNKGIKQSDKFVPKPDFTNQLANIYSAVDEEGLKRTFRRQNNLINSIDIQSLDELKSNFYQKLNIPNNTTKEQFIEIIKQQTNNIF